MSLFVDESLFSNRIKNDQQKGYVGGINIPSGKHDEEKKARIEIDEDDEHWRSSVEAT